MGGESNYQKHFTGNRSEDRVRKCPFCLSKTQSHVAFSQTTGSNWHLGWGRDSTSPLGSRRLLSLQFVAHPGQPDYSCLLVLWPFSAFRPSWGKAGRVVALEPLPSSSSKPLFAPRANHIRVTYKYESTSRPLNTWGAGEFKVRSQTLPHFCRDTGAFVMAGGSFFPPFHHAVTSGPHRNIPRLRDSMKVEPQLPTPNALRFQKDMH